MIAGRRATPDWLGAQGSFLYPRRLPMPDGFIPHDVIREPTRCLCSLPTSVYTPATTKADILFPFFLFSSLSIKHINLNLTNPLSQPHLQLKQQLNTMVAKEMNALLYSEVRTPALPIVILNADLLILPDHLGLTIILCSFFPLLLPTTTCHYPTDSLGSSRLRRFPCPKSAPRRSS